MQTGNNNKSVLILPDIHHRIDEAEKIIKHVGADEIIFLGDYFDDFNDTPEMVRDTSEWLEWSVKQPNRIHIWGNHDPQYAYTYRTLHCGGYEEWKYWIVQEVLTHETWDKLVWWAWLDSFLLSHGGLHLFNLPENIQALYTDRPSFYKSIDEYLTQSKIKGFREAANNQRHWFLNAGHARGGSLRVGGLIWCDFIREFHPIRGLNQIVGHTPSPFGKPIWCRGKWDIQTNKKTISYPMIDTWTPNSFDNVNHSINLCLDVHANTHWAIWNGKTLKFGNILDDM